MGEESTRRVLVIKKYARTHDYDASALHKKPVHKMIPAGAEYWVPLSGKLLVCRRGTGRYGFKHVCEYGDLGLFGQVRQFKKIMRCVECHEIFSPQADLIKEAKQLYSDIDTPKFLAQLARMSGDLTVIDRHELP